MAEFGFRMVLDIGLNPFPGFLICPDLVAMHTDGKNSLERLDMGQGILKFFDSVGQSSLQLNDPLSHADACPQFLVAERFGNIVIRSGLEVSSSSAISMRIYFLPIESFQ